MVKIIARLGGAGILVLLLGPGAPRAAEPSAGWRAGVARVDTTPTEPVRMAGYASRTAPSQGVEHPLAAKALALADADGHRVVLLTCDIIAFRRAFSERVAARVTEKHGLPRADLVLFASHTHAGPAPADPADPFAANPPREGFENNVAYLKGLEDKLVDLVGAALGSLEPARLSYGLGRAHFALNRREPDGRGHIKLGKFPAGPVDEGVPILRVDDEDGKARAIVFGYACHNTTLRPDMTRIDADFAGYAQDRVEADHPGAVALFVTGCAGDADPHPFGTVAMARDHGRELGEAVQFVLDHPAWMTPLSGRLRSALVETTVRFSGPTDRASYERLRDDPNPGVQRHARRILEAIDAGRPIRSEYPHYSVHAFALGDPLTLVALSGEVVVDYALRLQRELGGEGQALWVAAYADDVLGYIPSLRVLKEGGYEGREAFYGSPWPTPFAEDIESTVVAAARKAVDEVRGR